MAVLSSSQRTTLEKAVKEARNSAQKGAVNALKSLGVDQTEPFGHMNPDQRSLRNRLRQKGRLLGDNLDQSGQQAIHKISYELAYETWHKMLFAKFLEVNSLLMHPDGVAVTLMDCEELAVEEGHLNKWETAMHYASLMLPAIFRPSDPIMQVHYSSNDRIELEEIISALDDTIFQADDALGWVYQFWQSEEKERINKSGNKIDGESLPAVTQLFTEPYMVDFLIDNTLGAWWVGRNPGVESPVKFEYIRLLDDGTPAAGKFEGWPDKTALVTCLDPCMGSGHFVVSLFLVLVRLRMHEEKLSKEEATDRVIKENLHGLEIDPRCTQIAAFNLALTAWKFCGHYRELPEMNLACSGIAPKGKEEDWVKLVGKVHRDDQVRMENGMRQLYRHFQLAPELGSLLDPNSIRADMETAGFELLQPVLDKALESELEGEQLERGVMAAGIARSGQLLSKKYFLQITNVPYLGKGKFDNILSEYVLQNYGEAKSDLATVFLERLFKTARIYGTVTTVIPQNWLFLASYRKYREKLLKNESWNLIARLGAGAFSQISGEVVKAILISIIHSKPISEQAILGLDVSGEPSATLKGQSLKVQSLKILNQKRQLENPDARVVFENLNTSGRIFQEFADAYQGIITGDRSRFIFKHWEIFSKNLIWDYFSDGFSNDYEIDGKDSFIRWENGKGTLHKHAEVNRDRLHDMHESGNKSWGKRGILVTRIGIRTNPYFGEKYDNNLICITPKDDSYDLIYTLVKSQLYKEKIRQIDQKLSLTNATALKVYFDENEIKELESIPPPISNRPSQWLFHGNPTITDNPLQVSIGRALGYQWPAESDPELDLDPQARELIQCIQTFDYLCDEDGIFCIPSVNGESAGADRLRDYLQTVWAEEYDINTVTKLLEKEGAKSTNLEAWLRDEYFEQHFKLFNHRPFIWQIWDGRKDGFSVLVNYHKLTKNNLSKLIYTYLGDWIRMCEAKKKSGESGADGLLSAALKLKESLELILTGEKPYDIFVRWKSLSEQPIGWDPDLNDGVRLNIRPFIEANILRKKPNIKWGIDRGKNPSGAHWGEVRDNDVHLSLEEKRRSKGI